MKDTSSEILEQLWQCHSCVLSLLFSRKKKVDTDSRRAKYNGRAPNGEHY